MSNIVSKNLLKNAIWSFVGQIGYLTITLISNIILVRLLSPKEFGQLGIIMFFIIVSNVLVESGLSGALIRKPNISEFDYSTIFIFNLIVSIVLMFLLIFSSGAIADLYNDPELKNALMVSSIILLLNALRITQTTKLVKEMRFKVKSFYEIIAAFLGGGIGIIFALKGAGIWSLVVLQLSTSLFLTIQLWLFVGPLKSYEFNFDSFRQFYKFGINTTLASLLNTAFDNIYQLILGKYFSISQTGYYYQAKKLQDIPTNILQMTVMGVIYSALSRLQENPIKFNNLYWRTINTGTIIVGFVCIVIFFFSENIVFILYGEQWLESAIYLKLLIVASFFYIQEVFSRVIFKVFDKTEIILKLEIFKKMIQFITIVYGIWISSIYFLLYSFIVVSIFSFLINYYYARKVQGFFFWNNFILIVKIMVICVFTVYLTDLISFKFHLDRMAKLWLFPIMTLIYFSLLSLFKVMNFRKELKILWALIV